MMKTELCTFLPQEAFTFCWVLQKYPGGKSDGFRIVCFEILELKNNKYKMREDLSPCNYFFFFYIKV